ncbi:type II toxin-antitoxin system ParD family antitoxin [Rhodocyclaceae bacterium SMB388]
MRRNTLNFALPESMRAYVDARVASGQYGNTSEYLRELIRKDQAEQVRERLRGLIADGLASGAAVPWDESDEYELVAIAHGETD